MARVMNIDCEVQVEKRHDSNVASVERHNSSYVITGSASTCNKTPDETYYDFNDGNKVPKDMSCPFESLVKGILLAPHPFSLMS